MRTEPPKSEQGSTAVSVIIPTLNEEKLISQALAQFTPELKKKYSIEIIISDGGSTDKTIEYSKKYCPEKIITLQKDTKQNISMGRNAGAFGSSGDILYFFNCDTIIHNIDEFFSTTLEKFSDPKIIALTCNVRVFPADVKMSDILFHKFYNTYAFLLNKVGIGMGRGECHMVKREYFFKLNGYNEQMAAGEDFDLYRRLEKFGKIKFLRNLTIYESPRRYRKFGYRQVFWDWTKNSISVILRGKSISKVWEQVR